MRRHRLDPASLLFGFAFTVMGSLYLAKGDDVSSLPHPGWLVPAGLVFVGILILASAVRRVIGVREPDEDVSINSDSDPDRS